MKNIQLSVAAAAALLSSGANAYTTYADGSKFFIAYNKDEDMMKVEAFVKPNTYLGLAMGNGMQGTDMIIFEAIYDGKVGDFVGVGYRPPKKDTIQDLKNVVIDKKDGFIHYIVSRKLKTNDSKEDTVIECGKEYRWTWVANTEVPTIV